MTETANPANTRELKLAECLVYVCKDKDTAGSAVTHVREMEREEETKFNLLVFNEAAELTLDLKTFMDPDGPSRSYVGKWLVIAYRTSG